MQNDVAVKVGALGRTSTRAILPGRGELNQEGALGGTGSPTFLPGGRNRRQRVKCDEDLSVRTDSVPNSKNGARASVGPRLKQENENEYFRIY